MEHIVCRWMFLKHTGSFCPIQIKDTVSEWRQTGVKQPIIALLLDCVLIWVGASRLDTGLLSSILPKLGVSVCMCARVHACACCQWILFFSSFYFLEKLTWLDFDVCEYHWMRRGPREEIKTLTEFATKKVQLVWTCGAAAGAGLRFISGKLKSNIQCKLFLFFFFYVRWEKISASKGIIRR